MVNGFPVILHQQSGDGITIRAEVPIIVIDDVLALICIQYGDERVSLTTEFDVTDPDVFETYSNKIIETFHRCQTTGEELPETWWL